jgi:hypothetical protein
MRAQALAVLDGRARGFDDVVRDGPPYPDRIHQSVLVFDLVDRLTSAVVEWADVAEARVDDWSALAPNRRRAPTRGGSSPTSATERTRWSPPIRTQLMLGHDDGPPPRPDRPRPPNAVLTPTGRARMVPTAWVELVASERTRPADAVSRDRR